MPYAAVDRFAHEAATGLTAHGGQRRAPGAVSVAAIAFVALLGFGSDFARMAVAQNGLSRSDQICIVQDREASAGIALMVLNAARGAEQRLDEALLKLSRARMYCRRGWIDFARVDYRALREAFPIAENQLHALFEAGRPIAALSTPFER